MTKGLRITLWILSSLAVLWTIISLVGMLSMVGMMGGSSAMIYRHGGMMGGMGGMMMGAMVHLGLTWIVMLGLDGVFIYLLVTRARARDPGEARA
ncbi:MAG: hypothetical protein ACREA0_02980 [bacterium]